MELKRDENGFYHKDGKAYPSVTTVLHGVKKFRAGDRAKIGSLVHYWLHSKLASRRLDPPVEPIWSMTSRQVHEEITRAIKMWQDLHLNLEPLYVEMPFTSEDGYAGQIDQINRIDDKIIVLDIKTGDFYDDYYYQMAAYVIGAEKHLNINIDEAWIVQIDLNVQRNPESKGKITIISKEDLIKYYFEFINKLEEFKVVYMK
jgi:CRISPR/Cas system-associated exonuclease Cas4 (RecB family)